MFVKQFDIEVKLKCEGVRITILFFWIFLSKKNVEKHKNKNADDGNKAQMGPVEIDGQ